MEAASSECLLTTLSAVTWSATFFNTLSNASAVTCSSIFFSDTSAAA
eukprot:CAMPEP_0181455958 /NCGR_PEP_ID=MMETSP1110-20121109/31024_1 /TAXON_ID=174948 /ORGANISM="Symbiodinium sp., Strain CCMP421" /LENGTH=46 /DNA_ID= /DNA_START= /DNA_END= /DNA_ORIENTATION=